MSNDSYEERCRGFTEACEQLWSLDELHLQEQTFHDEEVSFDARIRELKRQSTNAAREMLAAQEANVAVDRLYQAVGKALTAQTTAEREHKEWVERRDGILENNRVIMGREDEFLKDCVRKLVELNSLFKKVVKDEWLVVEDGIEDHAESIAGYDDSDAGHSGSNSIHVREHHEPSKSTRGNSTAAPADHNLERGHESDGNPFTSDDEEVEREDRSSRVESRPSRPGNPSADDHPMEGAEPDNDNDNPRASSETLGREPARSLTPSHAPTAMHQGPQTPRVPVGPDAEGASEPQTGESSRQRIKRKRKRISNESEHDNDGRQKAKATRRKQDQMDKPDPVIKRIKHHRLVSTSSMTMAELSKSYYRHFITQDSENRFCIIRCDVCGVHFQEGAAGGLRHLNTSPHHVSLKASRMPHGAKNDHVFRHMAIRIVDCSPKKMEAHNAQLKWDIGASKYTLRSAINVDPKLRKDCYHPKHPAILLPRVAESNRPRLTPASTDGPPTARISSPPQPQNDRRPYKFTPGQVYWVKEYSAKYYRIALALPLHDLEEIGLPRWSVIQWTDGKQSGLEYDDTVGCYVKPPWSKKDAIWHPMLYLDFPDERTEPEAAFVNLTFVRSFERDEIDEGNATFARVYEYLDHGRLWFMTAESTKEEEENTPSTSRAHPIAAGNQGSKVIEIDDDSDVEDLPPMDVVIDRTPTKPKPESAKKSGKGKERDTRPWVGRSSEIRGHSYSNPPPGLFSRQTRQSTLGVEQEVGPAPEAAME